jgi:hypothetical protein
MLQICYASYLEANLLTLEVMTHLKHYGLVPRLKMTVDDKCESRWYRKTDGYGPFDANYEGIENILVEGLEAY